MLPSQKFLWNENVTGLVCLRCEKHYAVDDPIVDQGIGCPTCLETGYPVSLRVDYAQKIFSTQSEAGMLRYASHLPYTSFQTLGAGMTPLIELTTRSDLLGVSQVWIKNDGANPTGSHKDRMSPLAVARAAELGRDTVIAASSGNAGVSLAAYAAAAGLRCVIVSTRQINPLWAFAIHATNAELHVTETSGDRWRYMQKKVAHEDWYPVTNFLNPPVGSNPFGVQGYKTIGYEIIEQAGNPPPTAIFVPVARGDLLWGIGQGMLEMQQAGLIHNIPKLIAIESGERISAVMKGADYRTRFPPQSDSPASIAGTTVTYQTIDMLNKTDGAAVVVTPSEADAAQLELAQHGFYAEVSAATVLPAVRKSLARGDIAQNDRVVLVITSHGYKEMPSIAPEKFIIPVSA